MKFFKSDPKPGKPMSIRGFAEGLFRIARALERMQVEGGYVQWLDGVPRIFIDGASEGGGTPLPDGTADYQVLRWDATAGEWIPDWVRWP